MVARADALPESTGAEVEAKMQEIQQRISGSVDNQRALERYEEVKDSTERLDEEVTMAEAQLEQEELRVQQRAQVRSMHYFYVCVWYECMYVCMSST
jgi:ferric-dicitrate binding protein FerR (iron transport regulator)